MFCSLKIYLLVQLSAAYVRGITSIERRMRSSGRGRPSVSKSYLGTVLSTPDRPKGRKKKCCSEHTVCLQFRLKHDKGKLLNEKYVQLAYDCSDARETRDMLLKHCPLSLCNANGRFEQTRLFPVFDDAPFTDFIVLYKPDIEETEKKTANSECVVHECGERKGKPTTVKLSSLPEDIVVTYMVPFLDPRSLVKVGLAAKPLWDIVFTGVALSSVYDTMTAVVNQRTVSFSAANIRETFEWDKMCFFRSQISSLRQSSVTSFFRALAASRGSARQVSTNLLRAVVGVQGLARIFSGEVSLGIKEIVSSTNWDYSRLSRYLLKAILRPEIIALQGHVEEIDPLAEFKDFKQNQIFWYGGILDEFLRVSLTSKAMFVCGDKRGELVEFSECYYEFLRSISKVRVAANDVLVNRTAVYSLKRTKKQIFSLQTHHKINTPSSKQGDPGAFSEKFNMALPALIHGFKSLNETHKVLFQAHPVLQKQHMFLAFKRSRGAGGIVV